MRTVILIGFLSVADAIREDYQSETTIHALAYFLVVSITMDIMEFIKKNL